jgi:protein-disulfide isomerase
MLEDRVSRRAILAAVAILAVVALGLQMGRGLSPALASRFNVDRERAPLSPTSERPASSTTDRNAVPPAAASPVAPEKIPSSENALPQPPAPQDASGIPDVDPHKAVGSKSAPVTMEVFSDFQCPACKTLYVATNRQLLENYVSAGKVYLIHRDFPLPIHAHSVVAARYGRAAAQIGKFEAVEQALFQNQEKGEQTGDVDGTVAGALSAAEMAKVRALVKGGTLDAAIDKDRKLGQMYNVTQTPTTVFHSKGQTYPYGGAMSYDTLKQFLDQLLSQK